MRNEDIREFMEFVIKHKEKEIYEEWEWEIISGDCN